MGNSAQEDGRILNYRQAPIPLMPKRDGYALADPFGQALYDRIRPLCGARKR